MMKVSQLSNFFALETLNKEKYNRPCDYVRDTALHKALDVHSQLYPQNGVTREHTSPSSVTSQDHQSIIVSADTVIVHENTILEKPKDKEHAISILLSLSGKRHSVFTAVCLLKPSACFSNSTASEVVERLHEQTTNTTIQLAQQDDLHVFLEETEVEFESLSQAQIESYVDTLEPMDKAGGYGIQGRGCLLVKQIQGCYYNVVGFPIQRFCKELRFFLS